MRKRPKHRFKTTRGEARPHKQATPGETKVPSISKTRYMVYVKKGERVWPNTSL